MARRAWVIGAAVGAVIVLATVPNLPRHTATTSATSPSTTVVESAATSTTAPLPTSTVAPTAPPTSISAGVVTAPPSPGRPVRDTPLFTTTTGSPQNTSPLDAAAFDSVIAAATTDLGDLSAGVAVIRDGQVVHTAAFGMENPFESRVATVHTRFRLASLSKLFTAVAIMQLVNEGAIKLDVSFADQLGVGGPFSDPRVATVTVRQLLSHMSGFPVSRDLFFGHGVETWHQAAKAAFGQTLLFDPGTAFQYSNTNFCLLGLLVEKVTGQSFEAAINARVLDPVGARAHLAPTTDAALGDALHASTPGRNYMEVLGPAGGWVATPLDIAKVVAALRADSPDDPLLDRATVDEMRVPVPVPVETPPPATWWSYGMGVMLFADGSWGHSGTIESTHAMVVNRPDGLTVALLVSGKFPSNSDDLFTIIDQAVAASTHA
ncbi:MAG: serine hydrolase [Ilumatobacteraceae bacterium]